MNESKNSIIDRSSDGERRGTAEQLVAHIYTKNIFTFWYLNLNNVMKSNIST